MGLNIGLNAITAGGLFLAAIFMVLMGFTLVSAASKIKEIPGFDESTGLKDIYNALRVAYILIFIAAGLTLILAILYAGHQKYWCPTEWIHGVVYVIIIALLVIGGVYAYGALTDIDNPLLEGKKNGSTGYIWAALFLGLFALMILIGTGSGRVGYNVMKDEANSRLKEAEVKIKETHAKVMSEPPRQIMRLDTGGLNVPQVKETSLTIDKKCPDKALPIQRGVRMSEARMPTRTVSVSETGMPNNSRMTVSETGMPGRTTVSVSEQGSAINIADQRLPPLNNPRSSGSYGSFNTNTPVPQERSFSVASAFPN